MNRRLLIIDDDQAVHRLVTTHLHEQQACCLSATNGPEGIQKAIEHKPTAILLDMDMPLMNGIEVCRRLKTEPQTRSIPVLFLTSDKSINSKVQGLELGAVDYVTKPFDPSELRARVRRAFRLAEEINNLNTQPGIDQVTGLWNRAYLIRQLEPLTASAERSGHMISCCLLSIDRFDDLAFKTGQPDGADLMREVADRIARSVRLEDITSRYDAHTIAILGLTADRRSTERLTSRLPGTISEIGARLFLDAESVTCSVGAVLAYHTAGPMILGAAESALTEAQIAGNRNVLVATESVQNRAGSVVFN